MSESEGGNRFPPVRPQKYSHNHHQRIREEEGASETIAVAKWLCGAKDSKK